MELVQTLFVVLFICVFTLHERREDKRRQRDRELWIKAHTYPKRKKQP